MPGDADPAEGRREIAHEERVDPHGAGPNRPPDALRTLARTGVDDPREPVGRRVGQRDRLLLVDERLEREHRAEHLALHDLALVRARHDEGRLVEQPPERGPPTAAHDLVPVRPRPLDEAVDPLEMLGMDQWRDGRRVVARVAEDVLVRVTVEELQQRARRRAPPRAGACRRGRPGRHRRTGRRPCGRRRPDRVGEDEQRPLAAELGRERDDVLRRDTPIAPCRLGRARERDPPHEGVCRERGADLLADALHDVEDARRKAGLHDEVGEQRARERRPLGRLEHHGAPGGQRGRRLPRREHERRVPRRDHDRGAARHAEHAVRGAVRLHVRSS